MGSTCLMSPYINRIHCNGIDSSLRLFRELWPINNDMCGKKLFKMLSFMTYYKIIEISGEVAFLPSFHCVTSFQQTDYIFVFLIDRILYTSNMEHMASN